MNKISPYEILKKRQPNFSYIRTWGCLAYVRISNPKRVKLASRAYEYIFIRYALNNEAYRFSDLKAKVIIEANDADSYEAKFPFISRDSGGNSGGTNMNITPDHTPVIRDSDENIIIDVTEL